ncbi:MAG: glycosyltransferase family 2 protein [Desulfatitalea sp.]|nr:glycosyltransferase family 2 protein [Desulfatitalea sp.]
MTANNRERYIGKAIESILAQTYTDFDLLIWDDGSTDNTFAIACEYAKKDNRIRLAAYDHRGPIRALGEAIAESFGPLIGWFEDGPPESATLEKALAKLESDPAVGVVFTRNGNHSIDAWNSFSRKPKSKDRLLRGLMAFPFFLMRRDFYDQGSATIQRSKQ